MKRAVVYYSLTENTKKAAEAVAEKTGAELIRIDMVKKMPESFSQQIMYGGMLASFGLCPKISGVPNDILSYDEIIVGTPIWAGKHSPAINTFLKNKEVRSKVTSVFTLSGGGDNKKCIPRLKKMLPNLKNTVALADQKLGREADDEKAIEEFVNDIMK